MKKILLLFVLLSGIACAQLVNPVFTLSQRTFLDTVYINKTDTTAMRTFSDLKYANKQAKIVYVADYGTDEQAIQDAIDDAGTGGIVEFEPNRTYTQSNGLLVNLYDKITLRGNNATLKRGNQQITTLSQTEDKNSTILNVDSVPSGWKVGDYLQVYADSNYTTSNLNAGQEITEINGNAITISPALGLRAGYADVGWQIGDKVRKVYAQLIGTIEYSCNVENLIFDGNKDNNRGNYYFSLNEAVWIFKRSQITACKFYNMPNENIFGNGMTITGCYAENLNGSFFHATGQDYYDLDNFYGHISNNTTYNTNILSTETITGHSEGVITWSATAGRINISNNFFFNGGEAVLGYVAWGGGTDGGTRDFIFTNNFCRNFTNITGLMYRNYSDNKPGHFAITNNVFDSCGTNDWTEYVLSLETYDSVYIAGNQLWGGTTWTNVPIWTNVQQGFQTGDIVTEDITANDITSTGLTVSNGNVYVWDASVLGTELYDYANAISDTSGSEANATLGWYALSAGTVAVESSDIQTGSYALKFTVANNNDVEGMKDTLTGFGVGQTYKISLWAKAGTTADTISQKITGWVGFDESPNDYVTSSWVQYIYYLTATNDTVIIAAYGSTLGTAYGGSTGDEILIDNLSIQKVAGGDVIARGNFGYGNYYFENTPVTNGYVPKTDGTGNVTWQPDIAVAGTGTFTIDGVWIDTTAAGLATVTQAVKDTIALVKNKLNASDTTAFRTFSDAKYATASHTHIDFFDTLSYSINIPDTVIAGDNAIWKIPNNITITEIASFTNSGTVTFNIEERAETTPNTAGVDLIGSDLVADTNQEETSTFSNASIDRDDWLALVVASISGDPTLFGVTIKYIKAN